MSVTSATFHIAKGAEPIPGYVLEQRLGVGGYGEVWRATAPGGLHKAIKFVFGRLEDSRAEAELKSLDRIKHLTHPFLLTLERIECVDRHLAIVTELAENSLRETFDACRESGLAGIPRKELLVYLAEAADALDYLSESHSLQHLDIKPENLLLVGNHVKVADFGLLKDLRQGAASLVTGLTPRYASPEVFDGRPTRFSDQYSLAVMYQELATGKLPFTGQTTATLASQHLHAAPDLSELTPLERFAVGKALAKDPDRRFPNCREFIKRLSHRSTAARFADLGDAAQPENGAAAPARTAGGSASDRCSPGVSETPLLQRHDGQTLAVTAPEGRSLPALDLATVKPVYRPTVFLGIGGAGGRALVRLRQLLVDRYGDASHTESLQFLYVDTDAGAVSRATSPTGNGPLRSKEAIVTPIRNTWDYRERAVGSLNSISRRWIYNIPRTRQTQGLRALGRLALLDHSGRLLEALKAAVVAATDKDAIRATAKCTGLPFQEADPRVFLIASLGGGTGGGMVLDMAYAVRQVLAETGFADAGLCGLLLCSTDRGSQDRSLAPANTFTCLEELQYFSLPGNDYPGEPACGLTGFRDDGPTFASTYLIGLGDGSSEEAVSRAIDQTATYLLLNSLTPTSAFLDACRRADAERRHEAALCLRTAGSVALGFDNGSIRPEWTEKLCKAVVQRWQGGRGAPAEETRIRLSDYDHLSEACDTSRKSYAIPDALMAQCRATLDVDPREFATRLHGMLRAELDCEVGAYLHHMVLNLLGSESRPGEKAVSLAICRLHSVVGIEEESDPELSRQIESLREFGDRIIHDGAVTVGENLNRWVLELVDAPDMRIAGARRVTDWMAAHVTSLHSDVQQRLRQATTERAEHRKHLLAICRDPKAKKHELPRECRRYVDLLVAEFTIDVVCKKIASVRPFITSCSERLRDYLRESNQLAEQFTLPNEALPENGKDGSNQDHDWGLTRSLANVVANDESAMLDQLDQEMEASFLDSGLRLHDILAAPDQTQTELVALMRATARKVIRQWANKAAMSHLRKLLDDNRPSQIGDFLKPTVGDALPQLAKAGGGGRRLLLVTPEHLNTAQLLDELHRASGDAVSVVCDGGNEMRLVYEVEGMSIDNLKTSLLRSRPDCEEIAFRLHTRVDIDW